MNLLYGALALLISLFVSQFCIRSCPARGRRCLMSFICVFAATALLGVIFAALKLGFFAQLTPADTVVRVLGLALFLAVLACSRAFNSARD